MDIRVDKRFASYFIAWNDGGEKNGTCAGGAATDWKRGVQARFVNIFMDGGGCTTYVWVQKCPEGWCRDANNLCRPKDASMFRHSCVAFSYIV